MADVSIATFDEEEELAAAETFEAMCRMCEQGKHEHVAETMVSNPRAESVWSNQRRELDLATPIYIAATWGHSDTVAVLLQNGANPHLRARACKNDFCVRGFPCAAPRDGRPGKPCPGYANPEHPDDPGTSALDAAKNRGLSHIIRVIK